MKNVEQSTGGIKNIQMPPQSTMTTANTDGAKGMSKRTKEEFAAFNLRIKKEMLQHQVIVDNKFCKWFETGTFDKEAVRHFATQFSVFSNLFLIAQTMKMINAVDLQEMRAAKEILANEIGVLYKPTKKESDESKAERAANAEALGDPSLVNTEGSIEGSTFRFQAAHFEWIVNFCKHVGLEFKDIGKRSHGTKSTLFFCDELCRLYGSEDFNCAAGASYAVENWAAAGFWKQLISGLEVYKEKEAPKLPLGFFTWHDQVEEQHAAHTHEELEELYFSEHEFDEDGFIARGNEMLDGVAAFWDGLNEDRLAQNYNSNH